MTTQELALRILQINHEAKEQARQNAMGDWEELLSKALDEIDRLCREQINTHAHAEAHHRLTLRKE